MSTAKGKVVERREQAPQRTGTEWRELFLSVFFLVMWLAVGTVTYSLMEHWSLLDGLYMSFITLTTIGYEETHELSDRGRVFTIFFAFIGIGIAAFGATRVAQQLISAHKIRQRRLARRIRQMKHHYIICGYGRIGRRVTYDLLAAGKDLVVLDRDPDKIRELHRAHLLCREGDATLEASLESVGIRHADGLITLLPEDALNVFVTLLARDMNPDLVIVARVTDENNRRRLIRAGASQVVAPANIGAIRMAQVILRPKVDEFLTHVLKADHAGLIMDEVTIEPESGLAGQTLASARFRQHFEAIVLAIIDAKSGEMHFNPGPRDPISPGDTLIVLGSQEMIDNLIQKGCSAHATVKDA